MQMTFSVVARDLMQALPPYVRASDWTQNNRTWFAAVQTEKPDVSDSGPIVAVAAFNLLPSLVMVKKTLGLILPFCAPWRHAGRHCPTFRFRGVIGRVLVWVLPGDGGCL